MQQNFSRLAVERIEKAAYFTGKNEIGSRNGDAGYHQGRRFVPPALFAGCRVKGRYAAAPLGVSPVGDRAAEITFFSRIRLFDARRILVLLIHGAIEVIAGHHYQTELWTVGRAVPFIAAQNSGAYFDGGRSEWGFGIQLRRERDGVDNFMSVCIDHAENAVLAARGDHRLEV